MQSKTHTRTFVPQSANRFHKPPQSAKKYSHAVIIGRFQPFHRGHLALFERAAEIADNILVLVGSSHAARTVHNPLSFVERTSTLNYCFGKFGSQTLNSTKIEYSALPDHHYNYNRWIEDVRTAVSNMTMGRVALVGFHKDESSDYLSWFKPNFDLVSVEPLVYGDRGVPCSATELREAEFNSASDDKNRAADYPHYLVSLASATSSAVMSSLREEHRYLSEYKKAWENSPFPPTFMCTDAVVIQSGHILVITRGQSPGKGLLALPGGFIDQNETGLDAALRELREETGLKVPVKVLKGSIFAEKTFDYPQRSLRGRTFSMAFGFKLDDSEDLPRVKGGDDAAKAMWMPIEQFRTSKPHFFDDHYDMIEWFLDQL